MRHKQTQDCFTFVHGARFRDHSAYIEGTPTVHFFTLFSAKKQVHRTTKFTSPSLTSLLSRNGLFGGISAHICNSLGTCVTISLNLIIC